MSNQMHAATASLAVALSATTVLGQWVTYANETSTRLVADPVVGVADPEERNYSVGDVDHDGDTDVVVSRKIPWTYPGGKRDVLLMNENGVLVDRTAQYGTDADVPGSMGMLDLTNDRKAILVDVDNDGWLDIVTAAMISDGLPKYIGHPRVYHNQGAVGGAWQGFRFEDSRIPQLMSVTGIAANPRFADVVAHDVTGDGFVDLYFSDIDGADEGPSENPANDYNNRLLINNGAGVFVDESTLRMGSYTGSMLGTAFGAVAHIGDMNNDGVEDIVKLNTLGASPQHIAIVYNNPLNEGYFFGHDIMYIGTPYGVSIGELNGDGRIDLIIIDDGEDKVGINEGPGPDGYANFTYSNLGPQSNGFGGDSVVADLNNDGWNDFIIADVDPDITGCQRTSHLYHNINGSSFPADSGNIPESLRKGTHDVAVLDINGDCWDDIIFGRCFATEIWINTAPGGSACKASTCPADLDGSGGVNGIDLAHVLGGWTGSVSYGSCPPHVPADLNQDCKVNGLDLALVLGAWGSCLR